MIQMKLFAKQTHTHRRQMLPKGRGVREGRLGSLGLADAN